MRLPIEIIDKVVTSSLDSFETLISWSKINVHFKDLIKENLGVLSVWDSDRDSTRVSPAPLNYDSISIESNTFCISSDWFRFEDILDFLEKFNNILVVIVSDRCYSDPLATMLCELTRGMSELGIARNLCIIYKTRTNFLSKLYFRELYHCSAQLRLCELHIVGNDLLDHESDMCDIDTIFEMTNLHNIATLYTLNIRACRRLVAPQLRIIKQLQVEKNCDVVEALKYCRKLSRIDQFQIPVWKEAVLPPCDNLTIINFNTDIERHLIDGSHVRESLTIKTSLKSSNPLFQNIKCHNITSLTIECGSNFWGVIKFTDCYFGNLKHYSSPLQTDWEDLIYAGCINLSSLSVSLASEDDLRKFNKIPFQLTAIALRSNGISEPLNQCKLSELTRELGYCKSPLRKVSKISFQLKSIWDCIMLQHLVLPILTDQTKLNLMLDITALKGDLEEIKLRDPELSILSIFKLPWTHHRFNFEIPKLMDFHLSTSSSCNYPQRRHSETTQTYNHMFNAPPISYNLAISPSHYRWNTLSGNSTAQARRTSVIETTPIHPRRQSFPNSYQTVTRLQLPIQTLVNSNATVPYSGIFDYDIVKIVCLDTV